MAAFDPAVAAPDSARPHVSQDETATPYVAISGLQSWIVEDPAGNRRMVFTTSDGMTIDGPLFDSEGRNIAAALLGSPRAVSSDDASAPVPSALSGLPPLPDLAPESTRSSHAPEPVQPPERQTSAAQMGETNVAAQTGPEGVQETAEVPEASDDDIPVLPPATDAGELLKQAAWFTAWFSAGQPKSNAPVLYFMADPTCIHCAASTEKLAPLVEAGDLDLRIILAPIISRDSVYQAASILQDQTPSSTFVAHEKAMIGSSPSPLKVRDPEDIEPDVVRALQRNVTWGRTNNVQGVPFWIYQGPDGPTIAAGRVTDQIIADVRPLPEEYAMEANR